MPAVTIQELGKHFSGRPALADVTFDVERGERVVFVGRNGAGKTTLLRLIGGALLPDSGRLTVAGHDSSDGAAVRAAVGLSLGEERSWYLRLSGLRNLEFFAALRGVDRAMARRQSAALLEELELADVAHRPVSTYSAGMRARLSIARARQGNPAVLVLDEPTRSLDPVATAGVHEQLRHMSRAGVTVVLSSHDLEEAAALADRVVVLAHGRVRAVESGGVDVRGLAAELRDGA